MKTHVLFLSGGSGKRLWPLSNDIYSKQFLRLFQRGNGENESMIMRAYRGVKEAGADDVTVATGLDQVSAIRSQLGSGVSICSEPCRRSTFPAIALAAAWMRSRGAGEEDAVICVPVDAYVEDDYYRALRRVGEAVLSSQEPLILMGVEPDEPSEKYGYILPASDAEASRVLSFHEKPGREEARDFIRRGALWNSGVFGFRLKYILKKSRELLGTDDDQALLEGYADLPRISFDLAVTEKEKNILVLRFHGAWKDIGTWNTLSDVLPGRVLGAAALDEKCENVSVINQMDTPVLCMGLKNAVVCAAPDGVLVADKETSVHLKEYADQVGAGARFAERSWGSYQVLAADHCSLIRRVMIRSGAKIAYQSDAEREETWIVASGEGDFSLEGTALTVRPGDNLRIPSGAACLLIPRKDMTFIQVQTGENLEAGNRPLTFLNDHDPGGWH